MAHPCIAQASRNVIERLRGERALPQAQFRPIDNPEKFAAELVQTIANGAPNDAAVTISEAIGQPAALSGQVGEREIGENDCPE